MDSGAETLVLSLSRWSRNSSSSTLTVQRMENSVKWCPLCSAPLHVLLETFDDLIHELNLTTPPSNRNATGVEKGIENSRKDAIMTGGWQCRSCSLHLLPSAQSACSRLNFASTQQQKSSYEIEKEFKIWENEMTSSCDHLVDHIRNAVVTKSRFLEEKAKELSKQEEHLRILEAELSNRLSDLHVSEHHYQEKLMKLNEYRDSLMFSIQIQLNDIRKREDRLTKDDKFTKGDNFTRNDKFTQEDEKQVEEEKLKKDENLARENKPSSKRKLVINSLKPSTTQPNYTQHLTTNSNPARIVNSTIGIKEYCSQEIEPSLMGEYSTDVENYRTMKINRFKFKIDQAKSFSSKNITKSPTAEVYGRDHFDQNCMKNDFWPFNSKKTNRQIPSVTVSSLENADTKVTGKICEVKQGKYYLESTVFPEASSRKCLFPQVTNIRLGQEKEDENGLKQNQQNIDLSLLSHRNRLQKPNYTQNSNENQSKSESTEIEYRFPNASYQSSSLQKTLEQTKLTSSRVICVETKCQKNDVGKKSQKNDVGKKSQKNDVGLLEKFHQPTSDILKAQWFNGRSQKRVLHNPAEKLNSKDVSGWTVQPRRGLIFHAIHD